MVSSKWRLAFAVMACVVALPSLAHAQSAIAGIVRDTSGAVLPGVTVEAASPALIEKTRAVTTDGEGRYNIVDLRPGVYSVTFSLEGFSTVKRDGIELPSNFTATLAAYAEPSPGAADAGMAPSTSDATTATPMAPPRRTNRMRI